MQRPIDFAGVAVDRWSVRILAGHAHDDEESFLRPIKRFANGLLVVLLAAVIGLSGWLFFAPPALIRVGAGYAAKIVCSNVFIAGREAEEVLASDVQAPGNPLLRLLTVEVDRTAQAVSAGLFGVFGNGLAVYRPGTGCATVPDGDMAKARQFTGPTAEILADADAPWPRGDGVVPSLDPELAAILNDSAMAGPGMRAMVVVHGGRIVGERYGPGFSATTPLLGWSMTKTVTAALVGVLTDDEKMSRDRAGLFEGWNGGERAKITVADMLGMSSGLEFNEDYGSVTDVTRMLYLEPDMAAFAASKPLAHEIGTTFNYSSGTATMMARVWQDAVGDEAAALAWPRKHLFGPLGMTSAIMETDARGTFVGSSYMYATARDWARFGQFLLQDGVWSGRRLVPEGYVEWMHTPNPASGGEYGRFAWLHGPQAGTPEGENPDADFDVPDDAYWALGHDGQTITVIPSRDLVVVRLGLTPSRQGYKPQAMVAALADLYARGSSATPTVE